MGAISQNSARMYEKKEEAANINHERYECPHPDCNKSFSRQEHLGRHKLNHWPKEIFTCNYLFPETKLTCGKTFVRKDLLVRHEKRHTKEKNRLHAKDSNNNTPANNNNDIVGVGEKIGIKRKQSKKRQQQKTTTANDSNTDDSGVATPKNKIRKKNLTKKLNTKIDRVSSVPISSKTIDNSNNSNGLNYPTSNSNLNQNKLNSKSLLNMTNLNDNNLGTATFFGNGTGQSSNIFDWLWAPEPKNKLNDTTNLNIQSNGGLNQPFNAIPQQQQMPHQMPHQQQQPQMPQQQMQMPMNVQMDHQQQQQQNLMNSMQQTPQQIQMPMNSQMNSPFVNKMNNGTNTANTMTPQDLFSVDYLNPDPLQHFMREINSSIFPFASTNEETNTTHNNNNNATNNNNNNNVGESISNNVSPTNVTIPDRKHSVTEIPHGNLRSTNMPQIQPSAIPGIKTGLSIAQSMIDLPRHSSEPGLYSRINMESKFNDSQSRSSSIDVTKDNTKVIPQAKLRYYDTRGEDVIDNLRKQKSNINEMRRQTSSPNSNSTGTPINSNSKFDINSRIDDVMDSYKEQLKSSLKAIPSLFSSDPRTKYALSEEKCQILFKHIPDISNIPIRVLQMTLKSFWDNFQPKYGLLHKPSFQVNNEPDILILSLIMTGAGYLGPKFRETISDPICGPLRWMIFSHPDFQPPSHTYIIQSLLMLENYEKACTNRYLHERSYLHHGTTIQLLRRTPSLGGHPLRDKKRNGHNNDGTHLDDFLSEEKIKNVVTRWVEFESLKRVAFFAFYMDVTHAVIFGYMNLFISFKQIHLDLPCPDELWSSYDLSFEKLSEFGFFGDDGSTSKYKNITFLSALKCLIRDVLKKLNNKEVINTSSINGIGNENEMSMLFDNGNQSIFGKKILLAGILSMMFQCQEEAFDPLIGVGAFIKGIGEEETKTMTWREVMAFAINYWFCEIQKSCNESNKCLTPDNAIDEDDEFNDEPILHVCDWNRNELQCKLPVYHMSQIILRIFHHDYYIFAGVPWRMNVRVGESEFDSVYQKILNFAQDKYNGGVSLIYAYQFLFQMFIRVDEKDPTRITVDHSYDLNTDIFMTRPNTLALVTLLIWSLNFVLYGPEVNIWDNGVNPRGSISSSFSSDSDPKTALRHEYNQQLKKKYIPIESFDNYLIRMYKLLYIANDQDVISFHNEIFRKANMITSIQNKQNMCGFLMHIIEIFSSSYWDLGKEFNRLLENCLERSLGKTSHTCYNMYDV